MEPNRNQSCRVNVDDGNVSAGNIRRNINEEELSEEDNLQASENLIPSNKKRMKCPNMGILGQWLLLFAVIIVGIQIIYMILLAAICLTKPTEECLDHENPPGTFKHILHCLFPLKDQVICTRKNNQLMIGPEDKEEISDLKPTFILTGHEGKKDDNTYIVEDKEERPIVFKDSFEDTRECPKPPHTIPKPEKQRISVRKCLEYQEKYVYPCPERITPNGGMERLNHCNWQLLALIINGENAYYGEFPHMALLGFNTTVDQWKCGGTVISERFILTAAHCTFTPNEGNVTYVRIGILRKSEEQTRFNTYNVKGIYKHKSYKAPSKYHDIALLETDRVMKLHRYAVPACLHNGSHINDLQVIATGWGTIRPKEDYVLDTLQKTTLDKFTDEECLRNLPTLSTRYLEKGYDRHTQICYGDKHENHDTCNGDSGGPTQIKHPHVTCMYLVTAITSNGKWCGVTGTPGLYTRVSYYLDWIEPIVWRTN